MVINNFDQSSTGVNLELSAFYDLNMSHINFAENFKTLDHVTDRFGGNSVYAYLDWGNIPVIDPSDIESYDYTKADLLSIFGSDEDMKEGCSYHNDKPFSKCTKNELVDYLEWELLSDERYKFFRKHLLPKFDVVEIRGFCQGDYAEIIVPHSFWDIVGTEKPDDVQAYFRKYFMDLFYSAPVFARITIDDEDFPLDAYMEDQYDYDKEEMIAIAEKHIKHDKKDLILSFLADMLPADLEYK